MKQLVHVVGTPLLSSVLLPPGLLGRDGATLLRPDSGGEFGEDWEQTCSSCCRARLTALGVELILAIFCCRVMLAWVLKSVTETAEPWPRLRLCADQSGGEDNDAAPPMVTCFFGGPTGYLAAMLFNCAPKLGSHCIPVCISSAESSMGEYSLVIINERSGKLKASSSSLSDSGPKENMLS